MSDPEGRTAAEWVTLVVSCLVLAVVIALIGVQTRGSRSPAAPVAAVHDTLVVGGRYHVDVTVTNEGDRTAADVQVIAELVRGGETRSSQQTIGFLAGSATVDLVFVFDDDPAGGDLTVSVAGFALP